MRNPKGAMPRRHCGSGGGTNAERPTPRFPTIGHLILNPTSHKPPAKPRWNKESTASILDPSILEIEINHSKMADSYPAETAMLSNFGNALTVHAESKASFSCRTIPARQSVFRLLSVAILRYLTQWETLE